MRLGVLRIDPKITKILVSTTFFYSLQHKKEKILNPESWILNPKSFWNSLFVCGKFLLTRVDQSMCLIFDDLFLTTLARHLATTQTFPPFFTSKNQEQWERNGFGREWVKIKEKVINLEYGLLKSRKRLSWNLPSRNGNFEFNLEKTRTPRVCVCDCVCVGCV